MTATVQKRLNIWTFPHIVLSYLAIQITLKLQGNTKQSKTAKHGQIHCGAWFFWLCRWPFLYFQATCLPPTPNSRHCRQSAAKMPPADPTRLFPPGFHTSWPLKPVGNNEPSSYVALSGPELPSSSDGREDYEHKRLCKAHRQQQVDDTMGQQAGYRWSVGCLGRPSILPSPTAAPSPPTTTSPTSSSTSTIPPGTTWHFPH